MADSTYQQPPAHTLTEYILTSLFYLSVEVPNDLSIQQIHIEATKDGAEPSN